MLTQHMFISQMEPFSPRFAKFVQGLIKAVIELIGQTHANPHLTEMNFVLVVKRYDKMKAHLETMRKHVSAEMMKVSHASLPLFFFFFSLFIS